MVATTKKAVVLVLVRIGYNNGTKFCEECHKWIYRAEIPYKTYIDAFGGMRCSECRHKVRHKRRQKKNHHKKNIGRTYIINVFAKTVIRMINENKILKLVIAFAILSVVVDWAVPVPEGPVAVAQILEKDPPQTLGVDGNLTMGQRDVSIDIEDAPMPANGTLSISTIGADDIDVQSMPPAGFSIIIDNQSATVTMHPVNIEPDTSADDNGNGD